MAKEKGKYKHIKGKGNKAQTKGKRKCKYKREKRFLQFKRQGKAKSHKGESNDKIQSMNQQKIHPRSCHKSRNNQIHIKRAFATWLQRKTWGVQLGEPSRG